MEGVDLSSGRVVGHPEVSTVGSVLPVTRPERLLGNAEMDCQVLAACLCGVVMYMRVISLAMITVI